MPSLTKSQRQFLAKHKVSLSRAFDATGLRTSEYKPQMKAGGFVVAYGVTPCGKGGHTLRTRAGHCVQCGTHNLAFLLRMEERADVYIARSAALALTKLGVSDDCYSRIDSLNKEGYGGARDWTLKFAETHDNAGELEFATHQALRKYSVVRTYSRTYFDVACEELFDCSAAVAKAALQSLAKARRVAL